MKRYALVSLHGSTAEQLVRYLPGNYKKIGFAPHNPEADSTDPTYFGPCMVIEGEDVAGWTLDGYVIPRLASGLHVAREIDLSHPVMKTIEEERNRITPDQARDKMLQFLKDNDLPEPDEVRYGEDEILLLWNDRKVAVVVELGS